MTRLVSKLLLDDRQWVVVVVEPTGKPQEYLCENEGQAEKLKALFAAPLREHHHPAPSHPEKPR